VLSEEAVRGFLNIAATREEISLAGEESCEIASELPAEIFGKARLQGMVPPLVERASFVIRKRDSHQHELIAEVIRLVVQMAWVGSAPRILEIVRIAGWFEGRGYELERLA